MGAKHAQKYAPVSLFLFIETPEFHALMQLLSELH